MKNVILDVIDVIFAVIAGITIGIVWFLAILMTIQLCGFDVAIGACFWCLILIVYFYILRR